MRFSLMAVLALFALSCSSTTSDGPFGGPVEGEPDSHCAGDAGLVVQPTSQASCHATTDGGDEEEEMPETHFGTAAYDDDCKYYVSFNVSPVQKGKDVTVVATATDLATGLPVKGAHVMLETAVGTSHAGPAPMSTENPDGTYTIEPFAFDQSGRWTIRFHFFQECNDLVPDSPHGHVAFFIDVP